MKILVCISKSPDTTSKISFTDGNTKFDENGVQYVVNPYDEWFALVRALEIKESLGGSVTIVTVGKATDDPVIRKALAIGADNAVRIDAEPTEAYFTATQISAYAKDHSFDLILLGKETINYNGSQIGGMVAELLNQPYISLATKLDIGIVLTAHPTEVKRRTLIQKYANLIEIMEQRHLYKKYPSKIIELDRKLYSEIAIIWKTDELKRTKPSPLDEARWGLAVIEDSLWDTIPKVYKRLNDIFRKNLKKDLPRDFNPIQFGSWMGGDRDGNPNVTAEVTKKVILFSRWQAAKLYEKELTKLIQDLSMEECSTKIKRATGNSYEPYRVYLRPIRDKVRLTHQIIEDHLNNNTVLDEKKLIQNKNEITLPLREVRNSLKVNRGEHIANADLLDLIRRVRCFGINLARLDIRQEADRHEKLLNEIFKKKKNIKFSSLTEIEKIKLLNKSIKEKKFFVDKIKIKDKENKEVWNTFKQIAKTPIECLGAYVISMTTSASDILSVSFLQKEANKKNSSSKIRND